MFTTQHAVLVSAVSTASQQGYSEQAQADSAGDAPVQHEGIGNSDAGRACCAARRRTALSGAPPPPRGSSAAPSAPPAASPAHGAGVKTEEF
jgi:hypothetical protein